MKEECERQKQLYVEATKELNKLKNKHKSIIFRDLQKLSTKYNVHFNVMCDVVLTYRMIGGRRENISNGVAKLAQKYCSDFMNSFKGDDLSFRDIYPNQPKFR